MVSSPYLSFSANRRTHGHYDFNSDPQFLSLAKYWSDLANIVCHERGIITFLEEKEDLFGKLAYQAL